MYNLNTVVHYSSFDKLLFYAAMYQQIATFGKMKACAGAHKFSPKNYYQNDLDPVVGKFIYRPGQ